MLSQDELSKRQELLRSVLKTANARLLELRKEWEAADLAEEWLTKLSPEDQEMLRSFNVRP